jgi:DinB superfamily
MLAVTVASLRGFPDVLEDHVRPLTGHHLDWRPASWAGIPSEAFTMREQLCHIRDIEIDGYHVRLRRMRDEEQPILASIDSEALVLPRRYAEADPAAVLAAFRAARAETLAIIDALDDRHLDRRGRFEGYGELTLRALIHYLCSHDQQHLAGIQWLLGQIDSHGSGIARPRNG